MPYMLPEKCKNLTPYQPLEGHYRIRLDANESPFAPSGMALLELAQNLATSELNRYPDPYATECCVLFSRRYNVPEKRVVAGNGSDELLCLIEENLLAKGGKIAIFDHDFSMYAFYARLAELNILSIEKDWNLSIDVDRTIRTVNEQNVEMLLFSNPCNPTSMLLEREQVERLVRETRALIVVDEAYMDFSPDETVLDLTGKYENLLVLKTCSKAVGLAGARIGFAVGSEELIGLLRSVKSPYNVNTLSQLAAAAVLRDIDYLDEIAATLMNNAQTLYDGIAALRRKSPEKIMLLPPVGANFVYVKTPYAAEIHAKLALSGIAVRLLDGALRITTGSEKQNRELLGQLRDILT